MRQRGRWTVVAAVLAAGWLASPAAVPLYDGVGFPDEPYRFVPARGAGQPAAVAEVRLKVVGGVNPGGLLANSTEVGPQVTVYAPPEAFAVPDPTSPGEIVLRAAPVPLMPPAPRGEVVSNVYAVTLTSRLGPVTVQPQAQTPAITLRSVTPGLPLPIVQYRPAPDQPWRPLRTRQVGRDIVNASAPGAGEYVLIRPAAVTKEDGGGRGPLLLVIGLAVVLVVGVLVGVRVLARQSEE
jgi:hypothetical protein